MSAGESVAITGGTGSFGRTMVKNLLTKGVSRINVLSRDEAKQDEMRRVIHDPRVRYFVGDVRDRDSVAAALVGMDRVFHAAALKQVPSCEFFPDQAVKTNVMGSHNVLQAAAEAGVKSVVCLSTDKAVYPINAMGMSKALMEKTATAFARNNLDAPMTVSITRYGNVMYSRGSVIPMFIDQVLSGRPLTLTDPGMTRFLMTLDESVDLVEHAFTHATAGDLFVRKAPAATIEVLARAVASLFGNDDPQIQVIGTRHGEKRHECLLAREERVRAVDEGDYYRVPMDSRSLQYEAYFDLGDRAVAELDDYTSATTEQLDVSAVRHLLLRVPEIAQRLGEDRVAVS